MLTEVLRDKNSRAFTEQHLKAKVEDIKEL